MRIKRSFVIAGLFLFIAGAWLISGQSLPSSPAETAATAERAAMSSAPAPEGAAQSAGDQAATPSGGSQAAAPDADAEAKKTPTVRVRTLKAESRVADVILRGHTEAERKVEVKAETAGAIAAVPAAEGANVKAGDVLCELEVKARTAMLNQAKARMREFQLKYEGSQKLSGKGYRSETTVATDEAAFQGAKAEVQRMEEELANTKIVAPFDGIVDRRMVEVGDYMNIGTPCALVVDEDPFLVIGQVSEREVASLTIGDAGAARLVTGEEVSGKIRYVSKTADPSTRTFRVELEVPNPDRTLRDGITAEIRISVKTVQAHRISPAILALDDHGKVGVRIVENGTVAFLPVNIVGDGQDGIWVTGLPESVTVITVGQEFVSAGQKVQVVEDNGGGQT